MEEHSNRTERQSVSESSTNRNHASVARVWNNSFKILYPINSSINEQYMFIEDLKPICYIPIREALGMISHFRLFLKATEKFYSVS